MCKLEHPIKKYVQMRYNPKTFAPEDGWANEEQLHADCKTVFDDLFPPEEDGTPNKLALLVHHQNNQTNEIAGAKSARMGVRKGMPDFEVNAAMKNIFFIEIKYGDGKLSKPQIKRIEQLKGFGFDVYLCKSLQEFIATLFAGMYQIMSELTGSEEILKILSKTKVRKL